MKPQKVYFRLSSHINNPTHVCYNPLDPMNEILLHEKEAYVFTAEELLELRKKWAAEAWDVADPIKKAIDDMLFKNEAHIQHVDKQTYIDNLKIE